MTSRRSTNPILPRWSIVIGARSSPPARQVPSPLKQKCSVTSSVFPRGAIAALQFVGSWIRLKGMSDPGTYVQVWSVTGSRSSMTATMTRSRYLSREAASRTPAGAAGCSIRTSAVSGMVEMNSSPSTTQDRPPLVLQPLHAGLRHHAAVRLDLLPHPLGDPADPQRRVEERLGERGQVGGRSYERPPDRHAEGEPLDPLLHPLRADPLARDAPDLLTVPLEVDLEHRAAEPAHHPVLQGDAGGRPEPVAGALDGVVEEHPDRRPGAQAP